MAMIPSFFPSILYNKTQVYPHNIHIAHNSYQERLQHMRQAVPQLAGGNGHVMQHGRRTLRNRAADACPARQRAAAIF
ncbi:MAG: hypothetical protein E7022_09140 [Desulfovibrio desulfuricans]|nr:hypothetical protein [Desulfovibrio desulfuricans]